MSHYDSSTTSNSIAHTAKFRQKILSQAGVAFHDDVSEAPDHLIALANHLSSMPPAFERCSTATDFLTVAQDFDPSSPEAVAASRLETPHPKYVSACTGEPERMWMRIVNEPILEPLAHLALERKLSRSEGSLWDLGREVMSDRATVLYDPKPDVAFGVALEEDASESDQEAPLSDDVLTDLEKNPTIRLVYSPLDRQTLIFPAFIYEARSDCDPILWAQNQAAVGAARSLAILRDLGQLSSATEPSPIVVLATSAGRSWQFHLATTTETRRGWGTNIFAISDLLDIRNTASRFRVQLLLLRVADWLQSAHRVWVETRIQMLRTRSVSIRSRSTPT